MCWCRPEIRTPFCGRPECHPPTPVAAAQPRPATREQELVAVVREAFDTFTPGQCKWFSKGPDGCTCLKCVADRLVLVTAQRDALQSQWDRRAAALASPPVEDGGVMVRVDAMLVEQMRAGGLQGPFSRVDLDESGTEPRLMLTVQREPTPDSVEWWRSVAAGLGVEIQKLKDLAAQAPPASDPPRLGCESPSNCDPKLDLCTHCQARTAPNGLTPPSWITARQSDPPGLVANWRPIETAPKRTDVLAGWADRPHWLPQVLQQDDAGMWFNGEESDYRPPTHWMPLPASPQAKED